VANADHSLDETDALESLLAFYLTVLRRKDRPEASWSFEKDGSIRVVTKSVPRQVLLWQATNPEARDFRVETLGKKYSSVPLREQGNGVYIGKVAAPKKGWTAFFVELTYDIGEEIPFKMTTAVRVVPDTLPFADKDPSKSGS
jgi:PhoPQ-activated pathogenicity-related protein